MNPTQKIPFIIAAAAAVSFSLLAFGETPTPKDPPHFDPVVQDIEGWKVHIEPQMLDGGPETEGARALKMLANHLQRIAILVQEPQLKALRETEIWGR